MLISEREFPCSWIPTKRCGLITRGELDKMMMESPNKKQHHQLNHWLDQGHTIYGQASYEDELSTIPNARANKVIIYKRWGIWMMITRLGLTKVFLYIRLVHVITLSCVSKFVLTMKDHKVWAPELIKNIVWLYGWIMYICWLEGGGIVHPLIIQSLCH